MRILVIDDDPITQRLLQATLQKADYEVIVAANGEAGVAYAQQLQPALIICDWQLPGMDGLEVCRQVKANTALATTFFLLLTSRTAVEDRIKGLDTGADDFLSKPIDLGELHARVRAGLRLYQAAQKLHLSVQAMEALAVDLQTQKQLLEVQFAEAADYVRSLLPKPTQDKVTINARFLPSKQLGGDCFDYYWLDPDYLLIYLLDVSGHGLSAALPSVSVQNLLKTQSLPDANFYQPSSVLTALNEAFQMSQQNEQYFTIWCGVYNHQKRQLFYASAGHPPALLLAPDPSTGPQVQQLKTRGSPIGMFPDTKYTMERCEVSEGSTLYIYSDGIYEITQADGSIWDLEGFIQVLAKSHWQNPDLDRLLAQIVVLNQQRPFEDDCSILQITF
jgi:phosphoserine phosphatase RsbU/P